ncbi:MAG: endonuclease domain-containing protein [Proteobacteria bacterium]|nr:endonuclease domain-containing protein [Pseudomonadota bacterium]
MDIKQKARQLREHSTDAEKLLWHHLRNRRLNGWKFRRQFPVGKYIVDFVCQELKLIIEIDGGQHADQITYDLERTRILNSKRYQVVRYWNNEVLGNLTGVLESLTLTLARRRTAQRERAYVHGWTVVEQCRSNCRGVRGE